MNNQSIYKFIVIPVLLIIIICLYFICADAKKNKVELFYEFSEYNGIEEAICQFIDDENGIRNFNNEKIIMVSYHQSEVTKTDTITISYMNDDDIYSLCKDTVQYIAFCNDIKDKKIIYIPKINHDKGVLISSCKKNREMFFKKYISKKQYTLMISKQKDRVHDIFHNESKRRTIMIFDKEKQLLDKKIISSI